MNHANLFLHNIKEVKIEERKMSNEGGSWTATDYIFVSTDGSTFRVSSLTPQTAVKDEA